MYFVCEAQGIGSSIMGLSALRLGGLFLCWVVLQQLVDQINVGHQHTAAAVSGAAKFVHSSTIVVALLQESNVSFVEVGNNLRRELANRLMVVDESAYLAAREATNWYDHDDYAIERVL